MITPEEEKLLTQGSVFLIEVGSIAPNPFQPRTEFDQEKLRDLADSIKQYGVLQPLVVTRKETETEAGIRVEYELIAGERRLRASKLAGLHHVPVVIRREEYNEKAKLELAIIENLQREDLNALERAKAFRKLIDDFELKHHEVAARVGKSREYVSNTVRLLGLPLEIQESLTRGEITEGHGRTLLSLDGRLEDQIALFKDIVGRRMSVRSAEKITKSIINSGLVDSNGNPINLELKSMEKKLADTLGTSVQIEMNGSRGKISIDFFSNDDLEAFLQKVVESRASIGKEKEVAQKSVDGILSETQVQPQPQVSAVKDDTILPPQEKQKIIIEEVDPVEELLKNFSG